MPRASVMFGGGAGEWHVTTADKSIYCKHWRPPDCKRQLLGMIVPSTATAQQRLLPEPRAGFIAAVSPSFKMLVVY